MLHGCGCGLVYPAALLVLSSECSVHPRLLVSNPSRFRPVELVWSGKHSKPKQEQEIGPCRLITLERHADSSRGPVPNQLVFGDNLSLLQTTLERHAGQVDLVYLDPPFATRGDFDISTKLGQRTLRSFAYRDGWGRDLAGYLTMLEARLSLVRELLSPRGSLYLHVDYRASGLVRCLLDQVFGRDSLVNEIIWYYKTGGASSRLGFARKHDTIFFYAKDPRRALWTPLSEKSYLRHRYGYRNVQIHADDHGPYTWINCRDVFDIPALRGNQPEKVDYPTQKPEALLERILLASSAPGSLVCDFFCGSGTTLVVAEKLGRRWLGCDTGLAAIHVTRKRLLELTPRPTFDLIACHSSRALQAGTRLGSGHLLVRTEQVAKRSLQVSLLGLMGESEPCVQGPSPAELFDYWAIDHEHNGEVFRPDWWAFRTRVRRELVLVAPVHHYARAGRKQVLVRACDPFGRQAECRLDLSLH